MAKLGDVTHGHEALRRQFPHVEAEALELFGETLCGGPSGEPDSEVVTALADMQLEAQEAASRGGGGTFLPTRECTVHLASESGATSGSDAAQRLSVEFEGGDDPPRVGTVLLLKGLPGPDGGKGKDNMKVAMAIPTGEVLSMELHDGPIRFWMCDYGMHELRLADASGDVFRYRFMATSPLGDFAAAMDRFHDSCDWVWDGGWTEELEEATMEMLAALDSHFEAMEVAFTKSPMGSMMMSELGPARRKLETSLAKALENHDAQAVGRVYGAVRSLLTNQSLLDTFSPMLGGGASAVPLKDSHLYQSVVAFEKARFGAASDAKRAEVKEALSTLILAADAHVAELDHGDGGFVVRWRTQVRETLVQMRDDPDATIHPLPFQQLRGEGGGYIADMMKSMCDSFGGPGGKAQRADTIEGLSSLSPQATFMEAQAKVTRWAESLVDECISFGSPVAPFEVHGREPWVHTVIASMSSLLSLGFGYVTQGAADAPTSKLIALIDRDRATLPLDAEEEFLEDRRRRDRLKDVCRVVRAARKKGQRLSLSVSTDFSGSLKALREHHGEHWVGPSLEAVWERMLPDQRVCAFELWLHEKGQVDASEAVTPPKLVAADFGHPHTHGQAYYVATRFFDREYRNLQPGFILAFAEAAFLKQAGFAFWDLGGADKSPMMAYKPQVAIEMDAATSFAASVSVQGPLLPPPSATGDAAAGQYASISDPQAAPPAGGARIPKGEVFADIGEDQLWGSQALRAREERTRAALEAAQKAAKHQQKPSKAARKATKQQQQQQKKPASESAAATISAPPAESKAAEATPAAPAEPLKGSDGASVGEAAAAGKAAESPSSADAAKALARQHFMTVFQQLLAEGVPQQDAAARALREVASR
eukprot:CAMPEP_0115587626 /NCGR_PEP_ID=MMETSP0272-20121206/8301_1 /TAXON_ID=71861 /ORGANISM="Scrippsiella trochoidea, Strain CCMP3099" /LENGTH=879 /DNA_ID=CAMNT_0003022707 /DNA_START=8 /DNA_END=2648 /DNA_ORIENTATION=+